MDYTTLLDVDYLSEEVDAARKSKKPLRSKKRRERTRKDRKPSKPVGHIGRRSNYRLRNL